MSELIDRQQAIDTAKDWYEGLICGSINGLIKRLNALPTIQPEPKKGEWIVHLYKVGVNRYECDTCHARCDIIYPYCPYCGEKKEGERYAIN